MPKRSHALPLNLEDLSSDTGSPLSPTSAPLLDILGVGGRDDVLARLGVVHDGLRVREEAVEAPVEDASGDEGVDVADAETARVEMLVWLRPCSLDGGYRQALCNQDICGEREGRGLQVLTA